MIRRILWSCFVVTTCAFAFPASALVPSDPFFPQQWYLENVQAPAAWEVTIGNPRSVVAVLDVGVDLDHPDFVGAIWTNPNETPGNGIDDDRNGYIDDVHGWDFVGNDADPSPAYDIVGSDPRDLHHGTVVAGIVAARGDNGDGVAGVDWLAKIMPLRVLHSDGSGDVDTVLVALRYAVEHGATIVNLSFVGHDRSTRLDDAIADAEQRGVLVVAAGGNEDRTGQGDLNRFPAYPICSGLHGASVLGVAATNQRNEKASFSSYGRCVDIAAPGERIAGTLFQDPGNTIVPLGGTVTATTFAQAYGGFFSGTSFAAPIVAGAASLVRGLLPAATPREVTAILQATADPVQGTAAVTAGELGAGRVNIARAVTEAQRQAATVASPARSFLEVTTPLASVGESVSVRIVVQSATGVPIIGRAVEVRSNRPNDAITPASVTTDAQGRASVTIRATEEGIATLSATVGGERLATSRAVFAAALSASIGPGSLLRGSAATVYLIGSNGKRYVYPDLQTFSSWHAEIGSVQRVSDVVLAAFPLGGLVTIRPGTSLVKIQTDPKVYAVERGGVLRWVASEATAVALYGSAWGKRVVDVPDAFFATYSLGLPLEVAAYPSGTLLEDAAGERYLLANGQRRHFSSVIAFLQNGFQHRDVIRVVDTNTYPAASDIVGIEPELARFVP